MRLFSTDKFAVSTDANGDGFFGFTFDGTSFPDLSALSELWDQYKVGGVQVRFIPNYSLTTNEEAYPTGAVPQRQQWVLHSVIDYDDSVVPTSASELVQYASYRFQSLSAQKPFKRYVQPKFTMVRSVTFDPGTLPSGGPPLTDPGTLPSLTTSTRPMRGWLDFSDIATWRGMKFVIQNCQPNSAIEFHVALKWYVSFKNRH